MFDLDIYFLYVRPSSMPPSGSTKRHVPFVKMPVTTALSSLTHRGLSSAYKSNNFFT